MARAKKAVEEVVEERKFAAPKAEDFDVIIKPIVTEKTMNLQKEQKKITVVVKKDANKAQIKLAFEAIFNVKVIDVKVMNVAPKAKRVGRYEGNVGGYKKAIVTLDPSENLDVLSE